jgi:hypothetical protein
MPSATKTILALVLLTAAAALPTPQLAGEGSFFDSVFTDTDSGVGYAIKNAEENTANLISSSKNGQASSAGGNAGSGPPPPPPPPHRRQANKICDGFQDLSGAAGTGDFTKSLMAACDTVDGESTDAAANVGQNIGSAELNTLSGIGSAIPRL